MPPRERPHEGEDFPLVILLGTFAYGDTYDTPFYTITLNAILSAYVGTTNSQLRHGGRFSMVFCDGHAKTILWHAGTSPKWGKVAMPVDTSYWPDWCRDPNEVQKGRGCTGPAPLLDSLPAETDE